MGATEMCERDSNWIFKIALSESASYFYEEIDGAIEGIGFPPPWIDCYI